MKARPPLHPRHPERICWGCDKYCPAHELACGNGTIRTPHPLELFGDDWLEWAETRRSSGALPPAASDTTDRRLASDADPAA